MKTCRLCTFPRMTDTQNKCPSCHAWQWSNVTGAVSGSDEDGGILFEEIKDANVERFTTGILDHCLGGGMVRSDLILLGGLPGGGKSTLVLQVAEAFCKHGECMYISAEEDVKAIKARGIRLKIKTDRRLRFIPAMGGMTDVGSLLLRRRPKFIIIDSLDALTGRNREAELAVLDVVKKYAVELQAPALVTSQVNKEAGFSGLMAKQHAVDVLLTLMPDETRMSENGEHVRILMTQKNRSGPAFCETSFEMTATGLLMLPDEEEEDPESAELDDELDE